MEVELPPDTIQSLLPKELWLEIGKHQAPAESAALFALNSTTRSHYTLSNIQYMLRHQELDYLQLFRYPALFLYFFRTQAITNAQEYLKILEEEILRNNTNIYISLRHLLITGQQDLNTKNEQDTFYGLISSPWVLESGCIAAILANEGWITDVANGNTTYQREHDACVIVNPLPHWYKPTTNNDLVVTLYNYFVYATEDSEYIYAHLIFDELKQLELLQHGYYRQVFNTADLAAPLDYYGFIRNATFPDSRVQAILDARAVPLKYKLLLEYRPWLLFPYNKILTSREIGRIQYAQYLPDLSSLRAVSRHALADLMRNTKLYEVVDYLIRHVPMMKQEFDSLIQSNRYYNAGVALYAVRHLDAINITQHLTNPIIKILLQAKKVTFPNYAIWQITPDYEILQTLKDRGHEKPPEKSGDYTMDQRYIWQYIQTIWG
jgi:hypothetical protein